MEPGVPRIGEVEPLAPKKGPDNDQHCPAHEMDGLNRERKLTIFGALDGLRSMYGANPKSTRTMPGIVTPAIIGSNIVSSSWRPKKYQGALDGLGVALWLANSSSGALMNSEKTKAKAVINRAAVNSAASRCGQTWTLSPGVALTSWMEPDFTTVNNL